MGTKTVSSFELARQEIRKAQSDYALIIGRTTELRKMFGQDWQKIVELSFDL